MLNIILFGAPGAGKGTQSKELVKKYELAYISTGDILRKEMAEETALGLKAKDVINRGELLSDDLPPHLHSPVPPRAARLNTSST